MQTFMKRYVPIISAFTLLIFLISPTVSNAKKNDGASYSEKDVEELAEALEFMFEEAAILSEDGEFISLDYDKIEKKYGEKADVTKLKKLKEQKTISDPGFVTLAYQYDELDYCIQDAIYDEFGGRWFAISLVSTAVGYMVDGEYKKAAQKLLDAGLKGNLIGVAATLTVIYFGCLYETEGWI